MTDLFTVHPVVGTLTILVLAWSLWVVSEVLFFLQAHADMSGGASAVCCALIALPGAAALGLRRLVGVSD